MNEKKPALYEARLPVFRLKITSFYQIYLWPSCYGENSFLIWRLMVSRRAPCYIFY